MNRPVNRNSRPQQALQAYLDALLQEATEELPPSNDEHLDAADTVQAGDVDEFQAAVLEEQVRDARKPAPSGGASQPDASAPPAMQPLRSDRPAAPLARWAEPAPQVSPPLLLPTEPALFELAAPDARIDLPTAEAEEPAAPIERVPAPGVHALASVPAPAPVVGSEPVARLETDKSAVDAQVRAPATDNQHNASTGGPPALTPEGRPLWASEPFECLLFDVAGLTLAVPLVCLGSIYSLAGQELTPLFGQPNWFLGILPSLSGNLKVLDTARWVMPDRYRDDFQQGLQYVISVQGYEWGLAVHQVSRSLRLDPNEIKWRSQRGQRPWLAGTVIEHMCALLDVAALAELIASGGAKAQEAAAIQTAKAAAKPAARAKR